jgi:hypothetical protein
MIKCTDCGKLLNKKQQRKYKDGLIKCLACLKKKVYSEKNYCKNCGKGIIRWNKILDKVIILKNFCNPPCRYEYWSKINRHKKGNIIITQIKIKLVTCVGCGNKFEKKETYNSGTDKKTRCKTCFKEYITKIEQIYCKNCGERVIRWNDFWDRRGANRSYCNLKCNREYLSKKRKEMNEI